MKNYLLALVLVVSFSGISQEITVKGKVTSESTPIQGATVSVKNSFNETVTDKEGNFALKVTEDNTVLEVFYFGL
jgi:hypothetical protein